jgi:hypothetical protein
MKRLGEHLISRNQAQSVVINGTQSHLLMKRLGEEPMRRLLLHHLMRRAIKRSSEVINAPPSLASPDEESNQEANQRVIRGPSEVHQRPIRGSSEGHPRCLLLHHLMRRAIKRSSEVIRGPSEVHQRPIRGASEGHPRPIRGSSEGHQRVIRGASEANQRGIRGSSEVPSHLDLCLLGQPLECLSRDLGGARVGRWPERRFVKARLELRVAYLMRDAIKDH